MKRLLTFLTVISLVFPSVFAQISTIDAETMEKLKLEKSLENIFLNKEEYSLKLAPDVEIAEKALSNWTNEEKPRFTYERLFYVEKTDDSQNIDKVSKIVRSISTMKGTEYYSNRHKKWETLYHDASLVKSPSQKEIKIPDDTEGSADGKTLYCMQDDNSFGKCYYKLNYTQSASTVAMCFDNFEPLKIGIVTAAKENNIIINLIVVDKGQYFLVYMLVQAYYPKVPALEAKMIASFNSRVDSTFKWFVKELNR